MLSPAPPERTVAPFKPSPEGAATHAIDLDKWYALLRRQGPLIAMCGILGLLIGVAYAVTAIPLYSATSSVLIDDRSVRGVQDLLPGAVLSPQDSVVESQIQLLQSEQIGMAVVDRLKLDKDEAFLNSRSSPLDIAWDAAFRAIDVRRWFAPAPMTLDEAGVSRKAALGRLQGGMSVRRVGRAYVLAISYVHQNREVAARIANAIADAYILDQLESKYESTRRASGWLQERIHELGEQSRQADLAVQKFRVENNLLSAGGRLISDQQLSEVNSQLIIARADTARARARYERIRSIIDNRQTDAVVTEALEQSVFNDLRSKYLDRSKRAADLADRFGPNHVQVVSLKNEMKEYERQIFEELGRIAESYRSDYEVARSRENSLESSLQNAMGVTAEANKTLVTLRDLEQQAQTFRDLQKNFMGRFEEAVQKQSFPITDARIITRASAPDFPTEPQKRRLMLKGLLMGLAAGIGLSILREKGDRVFRSRTQVRDELEVDFLGILPQVDIGDTPPASREVVPHDPRHIVAPPRLRAPIDNPLSVYAETLRTIKASADISLKGELCYVIGVISMFAGEGKSMTAKNLASLIASQGARTLLIDADLRSPRLTRSLSQKGRPGLIDLLTGDLALSDILAVEQDTGLMFLPSGASIPAAQTSNLLASERMSAILREAGDSFQYVIVDLPPIGPVVDVKAAADLFSAFVFIVEWGKTHRRAVRNALATEPRIRDRCLGIVLNKVSPSKMQLYENYGSDYYYRYGGASDEHITQGKAR